ncbi:DUF2270 domain-containing protein [Mangrovicoccus algicola]|uniref:DUF2270 domain-containing protein n=1 Tax=Mangrovicoccus algicola TaxID=2771008 RepID=A0A8J7CJB6_9RHOB|nr:DUF2270 domain-containing protein [Mangrovicoccus algicola]
MPARRQARTETREFTPAEIGALAHLYRGEVYRSTIWRTRLDTTTNWSVVTLGVALSITFASPGASALPLLLVGVLVTLFMVLEARRYRYFNVWRARARWMETHFYAPMLDDGDLHTEENWQKILARDYLRPEYHVGMTRAMGRRIRRNYLWILAIQFLAYLGKLTVHPVPAQSLSDVVGRAAIGPAPGWAVLGFGIAYLCAWAGLAEYVRRRDAASARRKGGGQSLG